MAGLSADEKRHTMHGAPVWARAATVFAGPLANFILAAAVIFGMLMATGVATDKPTVARLATLPGAAQGLLPGDALLALNGQPTPDWDSFYAAAENLPATPTVEYLVLRDGVEVTVTSGQPLPLGWACAGIRICPPSLTLIAPAVAASTMPSWPGSAPPSSPSATPCWQALAQVLGHNVLMYPTWNMAPPKLCLCVWHPTFLWHIKTLIRVAWLSLVLTATWRVMWWNFGWTAWK